ncbi:hypothetical protein [Flagellimonas marina]|uniref:Fibronectin type III-like domain-containing protein n=1 Tax=Flagellimonas marina TaxID=1775168 RepID=A0ABV8PSA2_9FLAO
MKLLDKNMNWAIEPGEFEVLVGSSSTGLQAKTSLILEQAN